jgi:hypothetical protein
LSAGGSGNCRCSATICAWRMSPRFRARAIEACRLSSHCNRRAGRSGHLGRD